MFSVKFIIVMSTGMEYCLTQYHSPGCERRYKSIAKLQKKAYKSRLNLFSETFTVYSGTLLSLFQQTNCSETVKQDACKVTPHPRNKVNVPPHLRDTVMCGRDIEKELKQEI